MQHFLLENNLPSPLDCVIIGFFEDDEDAPSAIRREPQIVDFFNQNQNTLQKSGEFICHFNKSLSIILYHLGKRENFNLEALKQSTAKIANIIKEKPWQSLAFIWPDFQDLNFQQQALELSIISLEYAFYQFLNYKHEAKPYQVHTIYHHFKAMKQDLNNAIAIASGMRLCMDLGNTPANDCNPSDLEQVAKELAKTHKHVKVKTYDEKDLKKMGMNTLLSVGQGSDTPPRLIEIHYQAKPKLKPLILVGKGITFDSGGICLKPAAGMYEMKYDMCGAASVLGVIKAIALMELPIHVIGILACAENMPSGKATRPGDVIKTYMGKTVEITNTDAEGRLVLADAIHHAKQFEPEALVDIATLTGAVIIALGHVYTGLMTANDALAQSLLHAGQQTLDKIWRLPLDKEYEDALFSMVADYANAADSREAGSITAAEFLQEFANDLNWAHLDIAGSAWVSGRNRQATGRPVALLVEWLKNYHYES
jgi:leucyl aminopeptidase